MRNMLRLDVDAAFDDRIFSSSVGVVIRDFKGSVLGAKACVIRHSSSVKGVELLAIRFGIYFCLAQWFSNVCIFSDSIQAVQAVNNPIDDMSRSRLIFNHRFLYL